MSPSLRQRLAADAPSRILVAVFGLVLLALALAELRSSDTLPALALSILDPLLTAVTFVFLVLGRRHRRGWRQRRFWDLLALAWFCRLLVEGLYYFDTALPFFSPAFAADLLYVLFYLNFAVAIELRPHLGPEPSARLVRRRLEGFAALTAIFGLLIYFALVVLPAPSGLSLIFVSQERGLLPYLLMRVSIDLFLIARVLVAAARWHSRWRSVYLLLGAALFCFTVRDVALVLQAAEAISGFPQSFGWNAFLLVPGVLVILAVRASRVVLDDGPAATSVEEFAREEVLRASPLALYMLTVPVIHLLLYPLDLLEEASRGARDVFSLVYLLVAGFIAARHQKVLESERREAMDSLEMEVARRERINLELELRQTEMEQFTYTISHELRAPLVTIHGFTGLLEGALEGEDPAGTAHIGRIRQAASDMSQLLSELLELSRVGWVLERKPGVSLSRVAEKVCSRLAIDEGDSSAAEIFIDPDMPLVEADEPRLEDLLTNLVVNAIKFTPAGERPRVHIGARAGDPPIFYVADHGRGIPVASQEKIFGLFDRLDHPEIEGTGVGLTLVKRIVEKHGGRVWVESDGPGTGTTVCFTLPDAPDRSL